MAVQAGYIQEYKSDKGYGFIENIFGYGSDRVFFHIKTIKKKSKKLAVRLDTDDSNNIFLWYEIELTDKGHQVSKFWDQVEKIPQSKKTELISLVESKWTGLNIWRLHKSLPKIERATLDLLGAERLIELRCKAGIEPKNIESFEDFIDSPEPLDQSSLLELFDRHKKRKDRGEIKNVYEGLPDALKSQVLRVSDPYRTHPWSRIPGGVEIVVEYQNEDVLLYDKVKKPSAYVSTFYRGPIQYADLKRRPHAEQMNYTKTQLSRIFVKGSSNRFTQESPSFQEVWNAETSTQLPSEVLKRFDPRRGGFRGPATFDDDIDNPLDGI